MQADGEAKKTMDVALNLKRKGLDSAFIAKTIGLSLSEVQRLD